MVTTFRLPDGFLWGTATAAHQVEGHNTNNNWYRWEQEGHTREKSGLACDWWGGRWKEDLDRAAQTGQNTHRFSIEWSRIQPAPDRWDASAIEQYRAMLQGLKERGLRPLLTLHHFTDPLWLYEQFGWETEAVVPLFAQYVRKVVEAFKEYVTDWVTINEPNVYALSAYVTGTFPSCHLGLDVALKVLANMLRGHAAAYRAIHEIQKEAHVGYALHYRPMVAARWWFPPDALVRRIHYHGVNMAFPSAISTGVLCSPIGKTRIPEVKGLQDFVGINYYSVDTVRFDIRNPKELFGRRYYPEGSDLSATKFIANIPGGLFDSIQWAAQTYPGTPILITENGVEDPADRIRPRYLVGHIRELWRAVDRGWPVKGYYHWSLVDNFEWERGWSQRFGLWGLDVQTQTRIRRPSVDIYQAICRENGLSGETLEKHGPEMRAGPLP